MARILTIGSINLDEVFTVPHFIRPGETMACKTYERFVGGKGNNQSTALVRAGAEVHHAGKVGQDGLFAVDLLRESGVDTSRVLTSDIPTGRALIQVDPSGQNCIILFGGANRGITEQDVDTFLDGWGPGDSVLFQNEVSSLAYAMEQAKLRGLKIYFNPSPADDIIAQLPLDSVDCFILNEIEGAILADRDVSTAREQADRILSALRTRFPRADILLTLGGSGSRFSSPRLEGPLSVAATADVPVDTTAAGDTFTGYFIAALLRNADVRRALEEASTAAGICVSRKGAVSSIPWRNEVLARLSSVS